MTSRGVLHFDFIKTTKDKKKINLFYEMGNYKLFKDNIQQRIANCVLKKLI